MQNNSLTPHSQTPEVLELNTLNTRLQEIRKIQDDWVKEQERVLGLIEELHILLDFELTQHKTTQAQETQSQESQPTTEGKND